MEEIILPFLSSRDGSFSVVMSVLALSSVKSPFDHVMRADNLKSKKLLDYTLAMFREYLCCAPDCKLLTAQFNTLTNKTFDVSN